jgi:hypothetical protein
VVTLEDRLRLQRMYTECNHLLYGSAEAAEAEGCTFPAQLSILLTPTHVQSMFACTPAAPVALIVAHTKQLHVARLCIL